MMGARPPQAAYAGSHSRSACTSQHRQVAAVLSPAEMHAIPEVIPGLLDDAGHVVQQAVRRQR